MKVIWGLLALGLLGVFTRAKPSHRHSLFDDSERTLIRVTRSDLDDEEPKVEHHKKIEKKRSTEEHLKRSRRAQQEDEFFQALLSRSAKTKNEQKRSFEDNGSQSKGFIIRDDWKGDSKISDADRTELENLFSAINAPAEKTEEKRSSHDGKMYDFTQWLVSQSSAIFTKSLKHIVDVERSLSKMIYNDDIIKKLKARKVQLLADGITKNETKSKEVSLADQALSDEKARKKFCKTKCYDINVSGINCRIICHPPHIDTTNGLQMQQLPYAPPCANPNCGVGVGQTPCAPQGCTPGYPQQMTGYPQTYNPYGGVVPPTTVYSPNRGYGHFHQHAKHHPKAAKGKKGKKEKDKSKDKKAKKGKKGSKVQDKHPVLEKQHDDSNSTDSSSSSSSEDKKKKKKKLQKLPEIPDTEDIDSEYEYEGPGAENELEYEHPHWLHHKSDHRKGAFGQGEGMGGGSVGGGGGGGGGLKAKYGPVTLNTLGATVHITPMSFSSPGGPSMPPAGIQIGPPNPSMVNNPMIPQQPYYSPMQNPYGVQPLPANQDESTQANVVEDAAARSFQPMPKDCEDYTHKKCQVFLDWPTDENNEIKASLRFKQNWHPDYRKKDSTKYKIFKEEIEKAFRDAYTQNPNFLGVNVTSFSEEDMKTAANFVLKFYQPENGALRLLSNAISNNYVMSMPVYKDTLLRDGLKHLRRNFVSRQKEVDKLPSKPAEKPEKRKKTSSLLDSESKAYQGCFKDKMPERDLPVRFSKFQMTPEWCVGRCKLAGYKFAGVQYAYLCFCGNKFGRYGKVEDKECSSHCYGDRNRFCGSFWHNSVYSIDGQKHDVAEFAHAKDDGDDDKDEGSANDNPDKKAADKEHAEVATNLMKAAEAALKAAKKLLPQGKKERRDAESELEQEKATALSALGAAQSVMDNSERQRKIEKRDADLHEGRDLLVSYLGNVGGYDRQYRSVDSQEEGEADAPKFEYKRMLIDESGDGEFVEKDGGEEEKKKHKRSVPHDVSKRRRRRSVKTEDEPVKAVEDKPKKVHKPRPQPAVVKNAHDKAEKKEIKKTKPTADKPKPKIATAKKVEKKPVADKVEKKEAKKEKRSVKPEEKVLHRSRRELVEEEEEPKTKRDIWLDDNKTSQMQSDINNGIESSLEILLDVFKGRKTLENFRESILKLKEDVASTLSVSKYQRSEVKAKIRSIIDKELPKRTTAFFKKLRDTIGDYAVSHAAVAPQAAEAEKAILDLPVLDTVAKKAKSTIQKRSAELAEEIKKATLDNLPSILKEHFKRNSEDDTKRRKRSSEKQ